MVRLFILSILCVFLSSDLKASNKTNLEVYHNYRESVRIEHSMELMGKYYDKSFLKELEYSSTISKHLSDLVERKLPQRFKAYKLRLTQKIIEQSMKYNFDPFFLAAVIAGESDFNPIAIGGVGEIGLMQIRPNTAKWMISLYGLPVKWRGDRTLRDPLHNVEIGAAYLSWLRKKFDDHSQLYLSAYNMGPGNLKDALSRDKWPKDYPKHVMKRYLSFYKEISEKNHGRILASKE